MMLEARQFSNVMKAALEKRTRYWTHSSHARQEYETGLALLSIAFCLSISRLLAAPETAWVTGRTSGRVRGDQTRNIRNKLMVIDRVRKTEYWCEKRRASGRTIDFEFPMKLLKGLGGACSFRNLQGLELELLRQTSAARARMRKPAWKHEAKVLYFFYICLGIGRLICVLDRTTSDLAICDNTDLTQ